MRYFFSVLHHCFLLLGVMVLPYSVTAQTTADSTRVSYTEEIINQPLIVDSLALRVQHEEQAIWKIGVNNITARRYGIHLIYERKLWAPAWSLLGEISPSYLRYYTGYSYSSPQRGTVNVRAQLAGRFYYNLERRIRKGHNAINFSANYFSVSLGAGLGRYSDLPFYLDILHGQPLHAQVALLYGLQRRLWRRGFIDINAGYAQLLTDKVAYNARQITGSVRVGLMLGGAPATRSYVPEITDGILRPQWYVGGQYGPYGYRVTDSYSNGPYGIQNRGLIFGPYLYIGRYLQPRLAVQLGVQYEHSRSPGDILLYLPQQGYYQINYNQHNVALPLLMRYTLTKLPQRRTQIDVLVGAALVTSWQRQKRQYIDGQSGPVITDINHDQITSVNPMAGLNIAYGFGRTRRIQATAEAVLIEPIFTKASTRPGISLGLRYRFKYL